MDPGVTRTEALATLPGRVPHHIPSLTQEVTTNLFLKVIMTLLFLKCYPLHLHP